MSRKDLEALGSQRESLSSNPLLVKAEVGKPRRRCFTLPASSFTYGMPSVCLDGGASEALSSWNTYQNASASAPKKLAERDFIALNKAAVQSGLTTAQEQQQYRATHDIRLRDDSERTSSQSKSKLQQEMAFGISTRPSTPLFDLLEHRYQERWLQERREAERRQREKIIKKKLQGKVYETRASLMRRYSEPVEPPPLWKMKRWEQIPANLETFRTDKARTEAFHHHASDATSRTGVFGHGVYQAAIC